MNRRQLMAFSAAAFAARAGFADPLAPAQGLEANLPGNGEALPDRLLLKDWRPRSIYKIPVTEIAKARYPIIDAHNHGFNTAAQARGIVETMDETGVERAVVFAGTGRPESFAQAREIYSAYPQRFDLWCLFDLRGVNDPDFGPGALKALEDCHRMGARGVGELHDKGRGLDASVGTEPAGWHAPVEFTGLGPHPDDSRMDSLFQKCSELGMPVSIHVSDPIWTYLPMDSHNDGYMDAFHWRLDDKPGLLGHDGLLESLERTLKKHNGTTFIACHLANLDYDLTRLGQMLDRNPNLYADFAARMSEISTIPRFTNQFFQKYQDRLVYGTDFTYTPGELRSTFRTLETLDEHYYYQDYSEYIWPFYGLGIPDAVLKKIYRENALRIFARARTGAS
jgi:uncharacterized protein